MTNEDIVRLWKIIDQELKILCEGILSEPMFQKQEPGEEMIEKWKHYAWMRECYMRRSEAMECECGKQSKPTPSPGKCECGCPMNTPYCKPKDTVEDKIDSIVMQWSKQDDLIKHLRDLVLLVAEREAIKWASNGRITK